jgi:hypothetical protein
MNLYTVRLAFESVMHLNILNDKIHNFVLQHRLGMGIGDEEGNVVALMSIIVNIAHTIGGVSLMAYLYRFPAQYNKVLRTLHHKTSELVAKNAFNFVCLLNLDTDSYRID